MVHLSPSSFTAAPTACRAFRCGRNKHKKWLDYAETCMLTMAGNKCPDWKKMLHNSILILYHINFAEVPQIFQMNVWIVS